MYLSTFRLSDAAPESLSVEEITELTPAGATPEDMRDVLVQFLSQTNEAYQDVYGMVHELGENGEDKSLFYYFEVEDDDWEEITGNIGYLLDDSVSEDMPGWVRQAFSCLYKKALKMAGIE